MSHLIVDCLMSPYDIEEQPPAAGDQKTRRFIVNQRGRSNSAALVLFLEAEGARCTACKGRRMAMRSDCPHARAVARLLKNIDHPTPTRGVVEDVAAGLAPFHADRFLVLDYTNHHQVRSTRRVSPIRWMWAESEFYPDGSHYFLRALDVDLQEIRMFLASSIHAMTEVEAKVAER